MSASRHRTSSFDGYYSGTLPGRRGEILDAALAVFAEKGYDGGTMREIASRVGVTEPALYRHYTGKEALYQDMIAEAGQRVTARVGERITAVDPARIREALESMLAMRRSPGNDDVRPVIGVLMTAAPHHDALGVMFRDHILRPIEERLTRMVPVIDGAYGIERTKVELSQRVRAFMSLFVGSYMTSRLFGDEGPEADAATVDAMLALMGWDDAGGGRR